MSFLNQLKDQASALKSAQVVLDSGHEANTHIANAAAQTAWLYVSDLAKQLSVINPAGPALNRNGKALWADMKLMNFRMDARQKKPLDPKVCCKVLVGLAFGLKTVAYPPGQIKSSLLDELAKLTRRQPSRFV